MAPSDMRSARAWELTILQVYNRPRSHGESTKQSKMRLKREMRNRGRREINLVGIESSTLSAGWKSAQAFSNVVY